MQAVILAGGLATRLGERTATLPKSLIEVAGRPFIDWQLERLSASGFSEVILCIGHLGEQLMAHVGDGRRFEVSVRYSQDGSRLLGTAGALKRASPLLEPEFLLTYGDSWLPFDYAAPLEDLLANPGALATMAVFENQGRWDSSNVRVHGELVERYAKDRRDGSLTFIDYGAIALRRTALDSVPADEPSDLGGLFAELASRGLVRAYPAPERFYEIGSEIGLCELEHRLRTL